MVTRLSSQQQTKPQFDAASPESGIVMLDASAAASATIPSSIDLLGQPLLEGGTESSNNQTTAAASVEVANSTLTTSMQSTRSTLLNPQDDSAARGHSSVCNSGNNNNSVMGSDEAWDSDHAPVSSSLADRNITSASAHNCGSSHGPNMFRSRKALSMSSGDGTKDELSGPAGEPQSGQTRKTTQHQRRRGRLNSHCSKSKKRRHKKNRHQIYLHRRHRTFSASSDSLQDDVAETGHSTQGGGIGGFSSFFFSSSSVDATAELHKSSSHSDVRHSSSRRKRIPATASSPMPAKTSSTIPFSPGASNSLHHNKATYYCYCCDQTVVRSTLSYMNWFAKILFWCSVVALAAAVVWYSYELTNNGTEAHLILWFSAGAFVLLGFPISMGGIIAHLANYNQPNVQCYIVRILWMVPIYSIESWLCLRFHKYAIYIETLRDFYESYVLYSFVQFLIQVLGGEEALILMLKDKSPTRGVHMWGMQWCIKPWLMGQPMRKTYQTISMPITKHHGHRRKQGSRGGEGTKHHCRYHHDPTDIAEHEDGSNGKATRRFNALNSAASKATTATRPLKRVHWKSPFFVYCKFGVLQYVLLKFVCSVVVMIAELNGHYHEGNFTYKGAYLYVCVVTNLSQCWALYCLIFFYYATKNELAPINPVGKFLSVKALVFFTWWQSVCISILLQMDLIKGYTSTGNGNNAGLTTPTDTNNPLSEADALALDDYGGAVMAGSTEWTKEDVAKALQDYLICIEMFIAAIVHAFVFPHSEYSPQAVEARSRALNQTPYNLPKHWRRLGRKWKEWDCKSAWSGTTHTTMSGDNKSGVNHTGSEQHHSGMVNYSDGDMELVPVTTENGLYRVDSADEDDDYLMSHPLDRLCLADDEEDMESGHNTGSGTLYYYDVDTGNMHDRRASSSLEPVQSEGSVAEDDHSDCSDDEAFSESEGEDCLATPRGMDGECSSGSSEGSGKRSDYDAMGSETSSSDDDDPMQPLVMRRRSSDGSQIEASADRQQGSTAARFEKPNFVRALLDSTIPQDLRDNTVGIIKGDYVVEKKTLLHHAATSDSYELFSRRSAQERLRRTRMAGTSHSRITTDLPEGVATDIVEVEEST